MHAIIFILFSKVLHITIITLNYNLEVGFVYYQGIVAVF